MLSHGGGGGARIGGGGTGGGGGNSLFNELSQIEEEEQEANNKDSSAFDPVLSTEKEAVLKQRRRRRREMMAATASRRNTLTPPDLVSDSRVPRRYSIGGGRGSGNKDLREAETRSLDCHNRRIILGSGRNYDITKRSSFRLDLNGNSGNGYLSSEAMSKPAGVTVEESEKSLDSGMFTGSDATSSAADTLERKDGGGDSAAAAPKRKFSKRWLVELARFLSLPSSSSNSNSAGKSSDEKMKASSGEPPPPPGNRNKDKYVGEEEEEEASAAVTVSGKEGSSAKRKDAGGKSEGSEQPFRESNGRAALIEEEERKKLPESDASAGEDAAGTSVPPSKRSLLHRARTFVVSKPFRSRPSQEQLLRVHSSSQFLSIPSAQPHQELVRQQMRRHTFGRVKNFVVNRDDWDNSAGEGDSNSRDRLGVKKSYSTPSTPRIGLRSTASLGLQGTPSSPLPSPRAPRRAMTPRPDLLSDRRSASRTSLFGGSPQPPSSYSKNSSCEDVNASLGVPDPVFLAARGIKVSADSRGGPPCCEGQDWRTRVWLELTHQSDDVEGGEFASGDENEERETGNDTPPPPAIPPRPATLLQLWHECRPTCNYQRDLNAASAVAAVEDREDMHKVLWYRFLGRYYDYADGDIVDRLNVLCMEALSPLFQRTVLLFRAGLMQISLVTIDVEEI